MQKVIDPVSGLHYKADRETIEAERDEANRWIVRQVRWVLANIPNGEEYVKEELANLPAYHRLYVFPNGSGFGHCWNHSPLFQWSQVRIMKAGGTSPLMTDYIAQTVRIRRQVDDRRLIKEYNEKKYDEIGRPAQAFEDAYAPTFKADVYPSDTHRDEALVAVQSISSRYYYRQFTCRIEDIYTTLEGLLDLLEPLIEFCRKQELEMKEKRQ